MRSWLFMMAGLLIVAAAGCDGYVSVADNPEPVDVSVSLTAGGKPVDDVKFNFQPTGDGLPAVVEVKAGKVQTKVTPGKYTWFVSAGKSDTALKAIPTKYHEGSLERQFDVKGGESIDLTLD